MPEQTFETLKSSAGKKAAEAAQAQASFGGGPSTQPSIPTTQPAGAIGPVGMTSTEALNQGFITEREKEIADAQQSFQETQQALSLIHI